MFNILFGLLGGKKSDKKQKKGYFLELDESKSTATETGESSEPASAETAKVAQATATEEESKPTPAAAKKTSSKTKTAEKTAPVKPAVPAWEPPFWVKAMQEATKKKTQEKAQAGMTFAPENLMPLSQSRRRPGPSLNAFRNMARQAKTPISKA